MDFSAKVLTTREQCSCFSPGRVAEWLKSPLKQLNHELWVEESDMFFKVPNGAEAVFVETTTQRIAKFIQGWIVEVRIHEKIALENTTVST